MMMERHQKRKEPITLFFSYSHEDIAFVRELEKHLKALQRQGVVIWYDRNIQAGENWRDEISKSLAEAKVILLLISPDYLASDFCWDIEMKAALDRQKTGEATVIPVIIRPADWQSSPISNLHVLPTDGKPIALWQNRDAAWANVIQAVKATITPASWIFQGVPSRYDIADINKVNDGLEETWLVTRYRKELKIGDIVYFWRAGEEKERGIYAWGKIIGNPKEYENWGWGVRIRYIRRLPHHLKASILGQDTDFADHLLYRMPTGTNFSLNDKQTGAINRAIQTSFGDDYVPGEAL